MKFLILCGLTMLLLFSGCASVSSTAVHYYSLTSERYPPKPRKEVIPVMAEPPSEPHKAIGKFQWETPRNWNFIRRSLEYNARENGADAVVLKNRESYRETVLTDVPPQVQMIPVTRYITVRRGSGKNKSYQTIPVTRWIPIMRPGYVAEDTTTWNIVDAEMIVFPERTKPLPREESVAAAGS